MLPFVSRPNSRLNILAVLLPALVIFMTNFSPAQADDNSQFFPETGHTVSGKFLDYWRNNGGLATYGYPITDAQNEVDPETGKTFLTQWFERNRFELHPENAGTKYEVLLGLLGKDLRREALEVDPDFLKADVLFNTVQPADQQVYFSETGHNLRFGFLDYWKRNGGLERFGFPISEELKEIDPETGKIFVMQWFERARFEYHPENQAPYNILLGLLGKQIKTPVPGSIDFAWKIGSNYNNLKHPTGVAIDNQNNIYVADTDNNRIQKYTDRGDFLTRWGSKGDMNGNFYADNLSSMRIVADKLGNVFTLEKSNSRIQKFDGNGQFITSWGGNGGENGQFNYANTIAIDGNSNLYIGDNNLRIQKFDKDGHFITAWGSRGEGNGQFGGEYGSISAITTDQDNNVYVADNGPNRRIQKFNNNGDFLNIVAGSDNNQFHSITGMVIDHAGALYVSDITGTKGGGIADLKIIKLNSSGRILLEWGGVGSNSDELNPDTDGIAALAIDKSNNVYIADSNNNRIAKFSSSGQFIAQWGNSEIKGTRFTLPTAIAVSKSGNLYITDSFEHTVSKFTSKGIFITKWGSKGVADGQFGGDSLQGGPYSIAVDNNENVFVTDPANYRIEKFDSNGQFLTKWGVQGTGNGEFITTSGLAVDKENNIYIGDGNDNGARIQKFDNNGNFIFMISSKETGEEQFRIRSYLSGVAVDNAFNVFIIDGYRDRVMKFDSKGNFITAWGQAGNNDGELAVPEGLALDNSGNVYVAERGQGFLTDPYLYLIGKRIQKFDNQGKFLGKWGSEGNGNGQFGQFAPGSLAIDQSGSIYVTDYGNNRIQKFNQH